MDFDENYLMKLLGEITSDNDIKPFEIPDIDLYMDQVTTFIDNKLCHHKRYSEDKILTKTMINNYTKSKILLPSKNKRYTKQHIILLVLIYYMKQILSISDINALFTPLFKSASNGVLSPQYLDDIYSIFLEIKNSDIEDMGKMLSQKLQSIEYMTKDFSEDSKDTAKILLTVLMLVTQASIQKRMAEKIIDQYFLKK